MGPGLPWAVIRVTPPSLCVTDGIHSVVALCTLRVTIITDDMLTNSITVRLENMSQEKFLSPLLSLFVEGVATVLSTTKDDVFVFNIQNDTDVSSNILNVTFSALLPGGVRGKFFPSEDLQEQIDLKFGRKQLYLKPEMLAGANEVAKSSGKRKLKIPSMTM